MCRSFNVKGGHRAQESELYDLINLSNNYHFPLV